MGAATLQEQTANDQGRMEKSLVDTLRVMEPIKHSNQAEFDRLEKEFKWLGATCATVQTAIGATIFVPEPITQAGSLLAGNVTVALAMKRARKIQSILSNGRALDEAFAERGIQIFADLPVPDNGRLDILAKFPLPPKKAIFAIALRSQGKASIVYNEKKEVFYIRRKGGTNRWTPDHVERLGVQGFWLRMNRQEELFGTSRNDRNRPIVKLLVITGETQIGQHPDHLYEQIGDQRVVLLQRKSSVYVLKEEQLIPFTQAWLAK